MTTTVLTISRLEARHLADLVAQFSELLENATSAPDAAEAADDPAVARLTPTPYPDDDEAAADFRSATSGDLLDRRSSDALRVLADLAPAFAEGDDTADPDDTLPIELDADAGWAWMRTLTAIRLVIATRLGIADDDDRPEDGDERYAVYDWIGFRLDGIVNALA